MTLPTPYYHDEAAGITIYHGDCQDILPCLEGDVDLIFTSPPYNLGVTSGGVFARDGHDLRGGRTGSKWNAPDLAKGYAGFDDAMPWEDYEQFHRDVLQQCWNNLSSRGAIFYNHKPRVQDKQVRLPIQWNPGLPIRQIVIWARAGGMNFSPSHYCPTHEWIVIYAKDDFALKSRGASGVGDVWSVPQEANAFHPAPFPVALPSIAIETTAPRLVLDPFMGSGTTIRAAKNAGVPAIGIEQSERYCEIAVRRMSQSVMNFGEAA